nr:adenylate cyclase type 10-like [Nomia melanderi]
MNLAVSANREPSCQNRPQNPASMKVGIRVGVSDVYTIEEKELAWTPDLIGPIFKNESIGLREVLITHRSDKRIRILATFVPDELIYETDISRKNFRKFNAVLALVDVSRIFNLYEKFANAENGGSYALMDMLNTYIGIIIEEVYYTRGDVMKFSRDGLLVLWKIGKDDFFSSMVYNVIIYAQKIQQVVASVKNKLLIPKVDVVISAGEMTFSVIGHDKARDFVISGSPIEDLKFARRICLPGDLVLSSSAWEHCAPSQYEYVIKDSSNVKIIRVLGLPVGSVTTVARKRPVQDVFERSLTSESKRVSQLEEASSGVSDLDEESEKFSLISDRSKSRLSILPIGAVQVARVSMIEVLKQRLGIDLETYISKPVLNQIRADVPLEHLTEVRRVTVMSVNVVPSRCSVYELISLIDELFTVLLNIVNKYSGCVNLMNTYTRDILFNVVFGLKGYEETGGENPANNGVSSVPEIFNETKRVGGVKTVSIGVSTGMAFCGVIGHPARREYMVFGVPVDKATSLMSISFGKVMSCDYDTVLYSSMKTDRFRSRGMKTLKGFGKAHVYEILDTYFLSEEYLSGIDYVYPILGRSRDLELFKDILDEIGVAGKNYSGILVEGAERSGKSRLLDAFVTIGQNRQLTLLKLPLLESFVEKEFSVVYHLLLQLFDATDCTTIEERERIVSSKLSDFVQYNDLCYLNAMMKVQFPLSEEYCKSTDWERHTRTTEIFKTIFKKCGKHICILLDDVQNMDVLSWKFLSASMENDNVIIAMTLLEPVSWDHLSQVQLAICQDKRLMNRSLVELDPQYITAFACQFLNVLAIPKELDKVLRKRGKSSFAWCEAFLTSTLQIRALDFVNITPMDPRIKDLVFPDCSLVTKVPSNLTPEELAPPLHWSQMSTANVCVPSGVMRGFVETNRDVIGLRIDIYNRMNSYEQDFVKCAATLGRIFARNMIGNLMINAAPLYTSKGNCGRDDKAEDHGVRDDPKETVPRRRVDAVLVQEAQDFQQPAPLGHLQLSTASTLPSYAHCQHLEFTIASYRKLLYNILPLHERREYHLKAAAILERDARRCSTCGGGSFLAIFSKDEERQPGVEKVPSTTSISTIRRRRTYSRLMDRGNSKRNILVLANETSDTERRRESLSIRRISILPGFDDDEDEEEVTVNVVERRPSNGAKKFGIPWESRLKQLSHLDNRNCRCIDKIDYFFSQLHYHIQNIGTISNLDVEKLTKFMQEYSAGLISTGQPIFATKFLADITTKIGVTKANEQLIVNVTDEISCKGVTLLLIGDAYIATGNYAQAKKFYKEAVVLRNGPRLSNKLACYSLIMEKLRYKLQGLPNYLLNRASGQAAAKKLELAIYLQRLSMALMMDGGPKIAKRTMIKSFDAAFQTIGGFLEKGQVYLTAVQTFRDDYSYVRSLEKPMMHAVEEKTSWNSAEEAATLANVYRVFLENRLLNGELKEYVDTGINLLKICGCLRYNRLKIAVLPTLIEAMVTVYLPVVL